MKLISTILFCFISVCLQAQETIKPICTIHITTGGENKLKGLLLFTNDSSVTVYPGKRKQWNKGKKFNAVVFDANRIKRITIKKNNRALKGMTIGAVVGALPILAGSKDGDKSGLQALTQLTMPVGGIAGAALGLTQQKTFYINGSVQQFRTFQKSIK